MLENIDWRWVFTTVGAALGGGALYRAVDKTYGGVRKVVDDAGTDRAKSAAEATWKQALEDQKGTIAELRAEIVSLRDELKKRHAEKMADDQMYDEQVKANTELRRRLGVIGRRSDIYTDLGAGLEG